MIGSVPASRRANAFAQLLDASPLEEPRPGDEAADPSPEGESPAATRAEAASGEAEQPALLSVACRLAALPRPALSATAKAEQRAALVAAMEAASAPASRTAPAQAHRGELVPEQRPHGPGRGTHRAAPVSGMNRLRPRTRLTKGLAAGGLTVSVAAGALGGVAAASSDALPGDTLYGLKRGMEDLRLDFASGDVDRGELLLDHAGTRLNEARRLMERGRSGPLDAGELDDVRAALASMRDDAAEGHRLLSQAYEPGGSTGPLESLSSFAEHHGLAWEHLRDQLPPALWDVSHEVTAVFDAIDQEIAPLQPLLPDEDSVTASTPGGRGDPTGPSADAETAEPSPPAQRGQSTPDSPRQDSGGAAASSRPSPEDEGLLGGSGLLDPPPPTGTSTDASGGSSDSSSDSGQTTPQPSLPQPDITIPPLVEDLLPDLGLDAPDTD